MTTENKTETPVSENKRVFAPLGKYAMFGVIMVSIIVTTAIMLEKELNETNDKIASIETEVSDMHDRKDAVEIISEKTVAETTPAKAVTPEAAASETTTNKTAADATPASTDTTVQTTDADVLVAKAETTDESTADTTGEQSDTDRKAAYEARTDALHVEEKQRMTEAFDRINALEAKHLEAYKADQDVQITRLREQLAEQQKMLDAWVQRNNKLYELRAAKLQRNQETRSEILNRI